MKNIWDKFRESLHVLNMIPCECGCKDDHWNVKDQIEGIVCEAEVVCDNCGKIVNYWAYGNLEFPETYTGILKRKFEKLKFRTQEFKFSKKAKRKHWTAKC